MGGIAVAVGMGLGLGGGMLSSLSELSERKKPGPGVAMLTAYDYPTARLLDEAGVDLLLVGDSLGMVVLGLPDTVGVTMADMLHHARAVRRGANRAPVVIRIFSFSLRVKAIASSHETCSTGRLPWPLKPLGFVPVTA